MKEARLADVDPGGGPPKDRVEVLAKGKQVRAEVLPNPYPAASRVVTDAVQLDSVDEDGETFIKLAPLPDVDDLEARPAAVFRFDPVLAQWQSPPRAA
jgi:hypothetical protein